MLSFRHIHTHFPSQGEEQLSPTLGTVPGMQWYVGQSTQATHKAHRSMRDIQGNAQREGNRDLAPTDIDTWSGYLPRGIIGDHVHHVLCLPPHLHQTAVGQHGSISGGALSQVSIFEVFVVEHVGEPAHVQLV